VAGERNKIWTRNETMDSSTIGIIILLVVLGGLYVWYAKIVGNRNGANEALSGIDVQLKKRSNLIPNILTIAQKFMDHEKELLTKVTELRAQVERDYDAGDPAAVEGHLKAAGALDANLGRLMIAVEAYPNLKSDQTMLQAQRTYNEVEEHIAAARRFYNASVTRLNNSIQIFPGTLLAGLANARSMPFYETDEAAREPVNASDYLK
jgi:LemA protein